MIQTLLVSEEAMGEDLMERTEDRLSSLLRVGGSFSQQLLIVRWSWEKWCGCIHVLVDVMNMVVTMMVLTMMLLVVVVMLPIQLHRGMSKTWCITIEFINIGKKQLIDAHSLTPLHCHPVVACIVISYHFFRTVVVGVVVVLVVIYIRSYSQHVDDELYDIHDFV